MAELATRCLHGLSKGISVSLVHLSPSSSTRLGALKATSDTAIYKILRQLFAQHQSSSFVVTMSVVFVCDVVRIWLTSNQISGEKIADLLLPTKTPVLNAFALLGQ